MCESYLLCQQDTIAMVELLKVMEKYSCEEC